MGEDDKKIIPLRDDLESNQIIVALPGYGMMLLALIFKDYPTAGFLAIVTTIALFAVSRR